MARRLPTENESEFALWTFARSRPAKINRRVLVIHLDRNVGESIATLLRVKGMLASFAGGIREAAVTLDIWAPAIILLDTRVDDQSYAFAKRCREHENTSNVLLVAMSNFAPRESIEDLKAAGFDGHFRRPCETWRIIDVLSTFLQYDAVADPARGKMPR
ncbi:histidine kinase [Paraburkholderia sp. BCC1886]|uniref:histidine kinase n=1 Tax=Paraburkholderia sp. BCC1886 TaxID=2562670 RepID=UPI001184253C|nr:histidine kinase [Paraburkholderia sp. BCC1886]